MNLRTMTVIAPGPLATIQDLGRPGLGHLGIGRSGAADLVSFGRANLLVGNDNDAATVEMTLGGMRMRFDVDTTVAVAGARCEVLIDGAQAPFGAAIRLRAGQEMRCRTTKFGVRTYLAVGGGIDVPPVLGSRSTDTLSGLGPAPLSAGTILPLGEPTSVARQPFPPPAAEHNADPDRQGPLLVRPGPRADWFTPDAVALLYSSDWTVTPQADRVGVRLAGPALSRSVRSELPSEPMVAGALQVPPDGQPILFLADHPVTGGYPVIGVLADACLHHAAQLRPGETVRFARR